MNTPPVPVTRRDFLKTSASLAAGALVVTRATESLAAATTSGPFQATGTRIGEPTSNSVVIWTRLTAAPTRNSTGQDFVVTTTRGQVKPEDLPKPIGPVDELAGACTGAAGRVRLRYGTREDLSDGIATAFATVGPETDFTHHFRLRGLRAGTRYFYASESSSPGSETVGSVIRGSFETAPAAEANADVNFCVMTCQGYPDRGHPDGHHIYPSMLALRPQFTCLTGDLVYYDNDAPRAFTPRLGRYHWERMFSLPRLLEFNRQHSTYWLKDDHDTLDDDAWPGHKMGDFTFAEGVRIFREQAPLDEGPTYRTFRWGRHLQIWLTEGRDFRSVNTLPDGPDKTIWGTEQKAWFKRTVAGSTATWKVLISPTPLVGPDRPSGKNDNHSNAGFKTEGDELRAWLKANVPDNFFVICGDRHWQYHSVQPETGLNEFSVGAASDEHAAGSPGEDKRVHRFHLVKGGFLSANVKARGNVSTFECRLHDVHGAVVYSWQRERTVRV
jgi:alkaline phosphatase D